MRAQWEFRLMAFTVAAISQRKLKIFYFTCKCPSLSLAQYTFLANVTAVANLPKRTKNVVVRSIYAGGGGFKFLVLWFQNIFSSNGECSCVLYLIINYGYLTHLSKNTQCIFGRNPSTEVQITV